METFGPIEKRKIKKSSSLGKMILLLAGFVASVLIILGVVIVIKSGKLPFAKKNRSNDSKNENIQQETHGDNNAEISTPLSEEKIKEIMDQSPAEKNVVREESAEAVPKPLTNEEIQAIMNSK